MMQNELRIGNYIYGVSDRVEIVEEIKQETLTANHYLPDIINSPFECELKYFSPIPLTEDWLLKFGFKEKYKSNNRFINDNDFEIEIQGINYAYCIWGGEDAAFLTHFIGHCQYVHQLQNLYFALTGEELTIK